MWYYIFLPPRISSPMADTSPFFFLDGTWIYFFFFGSKINLALLWSLECREGEATSLLGPAFEKFCCIYVFLLGNSFSVRSLRCAIKYEKLPGNKERNPGSLCAKYLSEGLGFSWFHHTRPAYTQEKRWGVPGDCGPTWKVMRKMKCCFFGACRFPRKGQQKARRKLWMFSLQWPLICWLLPLQPHGVPSWWQREDGNGTGGLPARIPLRTSVTPFPTWLLFICSPNLGSFVTGFKRASCSLSLRTHLIYYFYCLIVLKLLLACLSSLFCLWILTF